MVAPNQNIRSSGSDNYKHIPNNTNPIWWKDPGLRRLNLGIAFMFSSAGAIGFDGSLINGLLAIPIFFANMGDTPSNTLGVIFGAIPLGAVFVFIPASIVSDAFGRRICVAIGTSVMAIAAIVQSFTFGPWAFFGTRFMIGVGLAFTQVGGPPLTTEIAHPRQRGQVTALLQTVFFWGSTVAACVTLGTLFLEDNTWAWRAPCILQALFPLIQLFGLLLVPESPRWLISKNRKDEALAILIKHHANGVADDPLVLFEFDEMVKAIEYEKEVATNSAFAEFLQTKGNRHRLLLCVLMGVFTQWAGNGVISYYLAPILSSIGITDAVAASSINLGLQVWNAIVAFGGAFAVEHFGRRPLLLIGTAGMFISLIITTALSAAFAERGNLAAGKAVVAFLFIFYGFYACSYSPLGVAYPVEILPFRLRSKGFAIYLTTLFLASFFNQWVNPLALAVLTWRLYFIYVGVLVVMFLCVFFLFPETKGRSLEEMAEIFDGVEAAVVHDIPGLKAGDLKEEEYTTKDHHVEDSLGLNEV